MRLLGLLLVTALLTACGVAPTTAAAGGSSSQDPTERLTVFAAASLRDAFDVIGAQFEREHPDVAVSFNFAGSSTLATQIAQGAPADVFASADPVQMDVVDDSGLLDGGATVFARNRLAIAVEPGNPLGVTGLEGLTRPDVTVVLAAGEVPAGRYAREALRAAGIEVEPASLEPDVRAVLSRVALGEADAGIVYSSDVAASDAVDAVEVPPERNVTARYPIATVADAANPAAADAFVALVRSPRGQDVLRDHGFSTP